VGPQIEIACVYDGPDLDTVARHWGVTAAEVAGVHSSILHRVAFCGFGVGFAYMTGIGEARAVPRRPRPRTTVPAGSVAVAGPYTGIYPRPSPGGWNLIGRTDAVLWDASRPVPALLAPGHRVRFVDGGR
jgi:KipI family sensor histidine kinase inhibitor